MAGIPLVVQSWKGGAGKTTLSAVVASAASTAGMSVQLVDSDNQRSLSTWSERGGGALPSALPATPDSILSVVEESLKDHELVIVDTQPRESKVLEELLMHLENVIVLVPVKLTRMDYDAAEATVKSIERLQTQRARKRLPAIRWGLVRSMVPPRPQVLSTAIDSLLEELGNVVGSLTNRAAYAESLSGAQNIFDLRPVPTAVLEEVHSLFQGVIKLATEGGPRA